MNCYYSQTLISAFIDRELDLDERRELRKHLFSCSECSLEYQEFLKLKTCLENLAQEPLPFDLIESLKIRLTGEERSVFASLGKFFWFSRLSIVGACLVIFFASTLLLFPVNQVNTQLAKNLDSRFGPEPLDQNFSLDQSVTVYQASFILP